MISLKIGFNTIDLSENTSIKNIHRKKRMLFLLMC